MCIINIAYRCVGNHETSPGWSWPGRSVCWVESICCSMRRHSSFKCCFFNNNNWQNSCWMFCKCFLSLVCWVDSIYSMGIEWHSPVSVSVFVYLCFYICVSVLLCFCVSVLSVFLHLCVESIQYIQWGLNDTLQFLYLSPGFDCSQKVDIQCLCNDGFARFDGSLYDGWWLTGERNETVKMAPMALTLDKIGFTLTK